MPDTRAREFKELAARCPADRDQPPAVRQPGSVRRFGGSGVSDQLERAEGFIDMRMSAIASGIADADLIVIQDASVFTLLGPAVGGGRIKVGSLTELKRKLTELKSKLAGRKHPGSAVVMVTLSEDAGLFSELTDNDIAARAELVAVLRESGFSLR
jgi:hypothetical protein